MREDPSQPFEVTYELPDGSFIKLHDELFMYAPIVFPPLPPYLCNLSLAELQSPYSALGESRSFRMKDSQSGL